MSDDLLGPQKGPSSVAKINAEVKAVKRRLEEIEDALAVEKARAEGGAVPYEVFRKELDFGYDTIGGRPPDLSTMGVTIIGGDLAVVKFEYQFEAMDATGQEIKDTIRAENEQAAMEVLRKIGYFVTKIKKVESKPKNERLKKFLWRTFAIVTFPIWVPLGLAVGVILNIIDVVELLCGMVSDIFDDVFYYFGKD